MSKRKNKKITTKKNHNLFLHFIRNHFLFVLLIPIVVYTQFVVLYDHLLYGFGDVDWGFLSFYRTYKELYPDIFSNFINTFKAWGVYAHQSYYIGFQGDIFGLNYKNFQITTHIFKTLATLAMYPVFFLLSKRSSVAFLGTILFSLSYAAVGTLYTTVTSSDFTAIFTLGFFLWSYILLIKGKIKGITWTVVALILLLLTLFLSTERMYPLLLFLVIFEVAIFVFKRKSNENLKSQCIRVLILFSPAFIVFLLKPILFTDFLTANGGQLFGRIINGEWALLLTPFATLGSILLPQNNWDFFGAIKTERLLWYLKFFLQGPFLISSIFTFVIGYFILKRSWLFIIVTNISFLLFGPAVYILAKHYIEGFDKSLIAPSLVGGYLLCIAGGAFVVWFREKKEEYLSIFLSPFFAFFFILVTWIAADTRIVFTAPHRYLTIPGLSIAFFVAAIIGMLFWALWQRKDYLRFSAFLPFLLLIPIIMTSVYQINNFFTDQLINGFGAYDKTMMRGQIGNYIKDLPTDKPSLFSFAFKDDPKNGYYYDNTMLGGFQTWMLWHEHINFNPKLAPDLLWNQQELLPSMVKEKDGKKWIFLREKYYDAKHFYAFKVKNKKVIDISKELRMQLGLEEISVPLE